MKRNGILFLCTGNSCRSQMAEGFARLFAPPGREIHSAGIVALGLNPRAVAAMREIRIDISTQKSKTLEAVPLDRIATLVTLCEHAEENCPNLSANIEERIHWPLEDPATARGTDEEVEAVFRRIREEIRRRIEGLLGKYPPSK